MFVFVRGIMKSNLPAKFIISMCLCLVAALTFVACKDKEVFAESSDFESYPEYWNDFNGEIFVPDIDDVTTDDNTITSSDGDNSFDNGITSSEEEDWTANFTEDDMNEDLTSSEVDTDKDNIPDDKDPDDDNDGITDDKDPDDDNDGIKDEDEVDYGNQGPLLLF